MNVKQILNRKAGAITKQRAGRLTGVGVRASQDFLDAKQKKVDNLEEKIDDLIDVSANVDHNAGQDKLTNERFSAIITQYHQYQEDLFIAKQKLKLAKRINASLKTN